MPKRSNDKCTCEFCAKQLARTVAKWGDSEAKQYLRQRLEGDKNTLIGR